MAGSGKSKGAPSRAKTWALRTVKIGVAAAVAGLLAIVIAVVIALQSLPDYGSLKSSPNGQMIRVHAADGSVIVSLGPSFGRWLDYDQIPQVMIDAMVSTEDKRFYHHPGVDPVGMARAAWVAVENRGTGRRLQGASTITQQVTRNIFLNNSYSFGRKIREMVLALALERKFSKRQILELYLNKVYFGGGAYGIDAASRKFFGHPATTLDLPEAAIVAGLVKAPSSYSPTADVDAAVARAQVVLHAGQQGGSHFGIGQRPVGLACAWQAMKVHQLAQFVAGRLRVQPPRQQHRARKRLWRRQVGHGQFGLPELAVKRCVVRHHGRLAHKPRGVLHDLRGIGRVGHHGVGDAGELGDERWYPHPGFHEALEPVHHPPLFKQHDGHLGRARALAGRDAGGFKVDDGDGWHA